jgi:hypothetical protein
MHVVVGDECREGFGNAVEEPLEALLREDVVEDVGEAAVGLDEAPGRVLRRRG